MTAVRLAATAINRANREGPPERLAHLVVDDVGIETDIAEGPLVELSFDHEENAETGKSRAPGNPVEEV